MKTIIQFVHSETDPYVEQLVQTKLDKLENKYDWVISADVAFKEEKDTTTGRGKICTIELSAPGPNIHAYSNEENFAAAAAASIKDVERQLQKRKEEMKSH